MKQTVRCPYCGYEAEFVDSSRVYNGKSYGRIWLCSQYPKCDAYVGVHRGTRRPLGRMANSELREAKKRAHAAFDPLWKRSMARKDAYVWLAGQLGIPVNKCHIGMFDVELCERTHCVCEALTRVREE